MDYFEGIFRPPSTEKKLDLLEYGIQLREDGQIIPEWRANQYTGRRYLVDRISGKPLIQRIDEIRSKNMSCDSCESKRILSINAKHSDRCSTEFFGSDTVLTKNGYAPKVSGICGGDYTRFNVCLECGKVQGDFPKDDPDMSTL